MVIGVSTLKEGCKPGHAEQVVKLLNRFDLPSIALTDKDGDACQCNTWQCAAPILARHSARYAVAIKLTLVNDAEHTEITGVILDSQNQDASEHLPAKTLANDAVDAELSLDVLHHLSRSQHPSSVVNIGLLPPEMSRRRRALDSIGGVMVALSLSSLAIGIVMVTMQGELTGRQCPHQPTGMRNCVWDMQPGYALGFAGFGALGIGAGFMLGWR